MGIRDEINRQKAEDQDLANRRKAYEESQKPKAAAPATTTTTAPATTTTSTGSTPSPPATPDANSSSLDWAKYYYNQLPSSQQISDFRTVYGYDTPYREAVKRAIGQPVDFVALKQQADAARQRLGPKGALAADFVGNTLNPTAALNFIPDYGPTVQGAVQSGLQSYGHGDKPSDVVQNTFLGGGVGAASTLAAMPSVLRDVGGQVAERAPGALIGYMFGTPFGHEFAGAGGGAALAGGEAIGRPFKLAGDYVRGLGTSATGTIANLPIWPTARAGLQQLLFGLGQTAAQGNATNFLPGP